MTSPAAAPPQISADGLWWWTGEEWVPAADGQAAGQEPVEAAGSFAEAASAEVLMGTARAWQSTVPRPSTGGWTTAQASPWGDTPHAFGAPVETGLSSDGATGRRPVGGDIIGRRAAGSRWTAWARPGRRR